MPRSQGSEGDYNWGLDRFLAEAQTLARFNHSNIVKVYRFFPARNTAYMVLHYEDGQSLKGWLKNLGRAPRQHELDKLLEPLLDALETIHKADYLHRDIAPDNIMIRRDGQPVLIDFGSARGDIAKHSKTISALVKPGYSPYEQYATTASRQGPWTDIYSLGATLYEAVTNKRPPDAPTRMVMDEMIPPADAALSSYRPGFLAAIARSLKLDMAERPQSVGQWRTELMAPPVKPAPQAAGGAAEAGSGRKARAEAKAKAKSAPPKAGVAQPVQEPAMADAADAKAFDPAASGQGQPAEAAPKRATALVVDDGIAAGADMAEATSRSGSPRGLAHAFLAGWRKAASTETDSLRAAQHPPAQQQPRPIGKAAQAAAKDNPANGKQPAPGAASVQGAKSDPKPRQANDDPPAVGRATVAAVQNGKARAEKAAQSPAKAQPKPPGKAMQWPALFKQKTDRKAAPPAPEPGARQATPRAFRRRAGRRWRPLVVKLVIGLGIAALAVMLQDKLPIVKREGTGVLTSHSGMDVALARIAAHKGPVTGLSYTPDGHVLISGSEDGTVKIWDPAKGELVRTIALADGAISSLAIAGGRVAAAHRDGTISVVNQDTGTTAARFKSGANGVRSILFAGSTVELAIGSNQGTVELWNIEKPESATKVFDGHDGAVVALAYAERGPFIASGGRDGTIRLWHLTKGELVRAYRQGHDAPVTALAFNPTGTMLVSADQAGQVRLWSTYSNRLKRRLDGPAGAINCVATTPDNEYVISGGADGTVRIWGAQTGKLWRTVKAGASAVTSVTVSPDTRKLAVGFADGAVRIFDFDATGRQQGSG
ncbi:MAG: protein kinase domain-containing protein [Hyphomicrobiaceae bacterium]